MKKKLSAVLCEAFRRPPMIGAAFGILLVLSPIVMGGHFYLMLFSLGGLIIVVGGVVTVAFMSFEAIEVHKAIAAIRQLFKEPQHPRDNLQTDVMAIIYCAKLVMEKGMRNLENVIDKVGIRDPFVKYGLTMVVSEYSPDEIRNMLDTAAEACFERDSVPVEILQAMTSHAPAFGMVGTLVGMVAMLCSMSGSVSELGPSLAVAFLSTLYGVLSARMVYIPAASRLRQIVDRKRFRNYLITEGMVLLVAKKTPMYVQDRLSSFLRPEFHDYHNVIDIKEAAKRFATAA